MKLKQLIGFFGLLALAACDADIEPVDQRLTTPEEQDPASYAAYVATLNAYKRSAHYTVCAVVDNAPEVIASEKNSLRSLPDSLDIVALVNPLSAFDREDVPAMQRKGTRVVLTADCSDPAAAAAAVDKALAAVAADGLDGLLLKFEGPVTDAARSASQAVVQKLATLGERTLLFSGNAAFVAAADREKFDFYLLDATQTASVFTLRSDVAYLTGYLGVAAAKVLPVVKPFGSINDAEGRAQEAPILAAQQAAALALGGIAFADASSDYYSVQGTYPHIRGAIELLNPAHEK